MKRRCATVAGLCAGVALMSWHGTAAGITAVTRRTAMAGVPPGAAAPAAGNAGTTTSPQPQAAAVMLLPGAATGRPQTASVPPPVRPGPGEALLPPPTPAAPQPAMARAGVRTNAAPHRVPAAVPSTGTTGTNGIPPARTASTVPMVPTVPR